MSCQSDTAAQLRPDSPRHGVLDLQEELSRLTGKRVRLFLTDNRRRMVSARKRKDGIFEVRLQRLFLDSPPDVLEELGNLLNGVRGDKSALDKFIDTRLATATVSTRPARPPGRERATSLHHDIQEYAASLNRLYLGGRSRAGVIWGRRNKTKSSRSIRFACYDPSRNLVIMNRKLDSQAIPRYFVEFVLFHEMLHEVLGIGERSDGKRDIHGSLFRLMESTYPDYEKALRFEKELCKRLDLL